MPSEITRIVLRAQDQEDSTRVSTEIAEASLDHHHLREDCKMQKNVVIISSSPRRHGNSDILCDQFASGAGDAGHHVEKIALRDKVVDYCTGCGACFSDGNACSQEDDMAEILDKMIAADVIVMATPFYFYMLAAQMKTLIDRTCARYREISNKEFYFIMTAAVADKGLLQRTLEAFRGFTACLDDPIEKGVIYGTGAWNIGEIKSSRVMDEAYAMGNNA